MDMTDPDLILKSCEELRLNIAKAGYVCDMEAGNIEGAKKWEQRIKLHKSNLKKWNKQKPIGEKS